MNTYLKKIVMSSLCIIQLFASAHLNDLVVHLETGELVSLDSRKMTWEGLSRYVQDLCMKKDPPVEDLIGFSIQFNGNPLLFLNYDDDAWTESIEKFIQENKSSNSIAKLKIGAFHPRKCAICFIGKPVSEFFVEPIFECSEIKDVGREFKFDSCGICKECTLKSLKPINGDRDVLKTMRCSGCRAFLKKDLKTRERICREPGVGTRADFVKNDELVNYVESFILNLQNKEFKELLKMLHQRADDDDIIYQAIFRKLNLLYEFMGPIAAHLELCQLFDTYVLTKNDWECFIHLMKIFKIHSIYGDDNCDFIITWAEDKIKEPFNFSSFISESHLLLNDVNNYRNERLYPENFNDSAIETVKNIACMSSELYVFFCDVMLSRFNESEIRLLLELFKSEDIQHSIKFSQEEKRAFRTIAVVLEWNMARLYRYTLN